MLAVGAGSVYPNRAHLGKEQLKMPEQSKTLPPAEGPACRVCGQPGHPGMSCEDRRALLPKLKRSERGAPADESYVDDPRPEQERVYREIS